ncbi:MAG: hypothetical protein GX601_14735, partial [Anaerolineales bacterium]|nr:hypothetical protein [Anaerolineales bacterium]
MSIEQIVEDWPTVQERWRAWWEQDLVDRPVVCVTAPREGMPAAQVEPVGPETQWTDVHHMVRRGLKIVRATYYGGEALPICFNPTSVGHALYFGCPVHYTDQATWVDPAPAGKDGRPSFDSWQESPWWRWALDTATAFAQGSQGRYFALPWNGNHTGDILAAVRGLDALMLDIALDPAWVKWAAKTVSDILIEVHEQLWATIQRELTGGIEGSCNHVGCWSPVRTWVFDCDISCMISTTAFNEIFLPPMVEAMQPVCHRVYHLDGPGAIRHLDALLALPDLHAIEWVPGAGRDEDMLTWVPLVQRIQEHGKSIVTSVPYAQVESFLRAVRPEGICIRTRAASE